MKKFFLAFILTLGATAALAQSMTSITPAYGPSGSSGGSMTIVGSGFSITPKATRFVDINNVDIFSGVSCASTTTCTVYPRSGLVPAGTIQTIAVYALVNGVKSATAANFIYYGAPTVSSVSPSSCATRSGVGGITITGSAFTSNGTGFPGTTGIYLYSNINDRSSGCTTTSSCTGYTAPALDCCAANGVYPISINTPGGATTAYFTYVSAPATPTITAITPNKGTRNGGNTVTITGTGFSTVSGKTTFNLETTGQFGGGGALSSVVCASTTSCTATMPPGNGKADLRVSVNTGASPGANSATSANTAGDNYTYAGLDIQPATQGSLYVTESGLNATYTIALTTQPTANVTVTLTVTGFTSEASVSPTSITFTPNDWNVKRTVTVTPNDDVNTDGNRGFGVAHSATSTDPNYSTSGNDMNFTNLDNETAAYFITQNSGLTTTELGGAATFKVVLSKAPTSTVTMNLTTADPGEGLVSPSSLTFATSAGGATGWNTPRTITVTGVDDAIADGDQFYNIIITASTADGTYAALTPSDVYVTNKDNEGTTIPVHGDFSGDGKPDIVLRNYSNGSNALWIMNGTSFSSITDLPALPALAYRFEGTADFNSDGKPDIVLRNTSTGANALWVMNGTSLATVVDLPALPSLAFSFDGTGDFDGNGTPDIILRNYTTGANALWMMDGTSLLSIVDLPNLPNLNFHFESAGDFNADGKLDIVLRNYSTGANAIWLMNGTAFSSIVDLPALPNTSFRFDGVADFNADGKQDLVVRNYSTGANAIWLMNGTALSTVQDLPLLSNVSYEFNGPR